MRKTLAPFVKRDDIFRFLQGQGSVPEELEQAMERALDAVFAAAVFRHVQKDSKVVRKNGGISLNGEIPLPYPSLETLFANSDRVYIVCCTIGPQVMRLIKKTLLTDPARGVIVDACASVVADAYAAYLQSALPEDTTMRFSPGYGDVPLALQRNLFRYLDVSKRIGVYLSQGDLMLPEKSVLFLAGNKPCDNKQRISHCASCDMDCAYRKGSQ